MVFRIDGKKTALEIEDRLKSEISRFITVANRPPGLAVVRIGDDPASKVYVSNKEKACKKVGISNYGKHLQANVSEEEVISTISNLNSDSRIDGILVQLPLPKGLRADPLLSSISPDKDADGLHTNNLGKLIKDEAGPRSCTPAGVMALLKTNQIPIEGQRAVVIGRSILVGKPMALMLQKANATVSIAHKHTKNLQQLTKQADILVVAAGVPLLIGAEHIKPGAVVIDVGIHRVTQKMLLADPTLKKLCGDVRSEEVAPIASAITPVPGGVGPMTVAMLLVNTVNRWQEHCGLPFSLKDLLP